MVDLYLDGATIIGVRRGGEWTRIEPTDQGHYRFAAVHDYLVSAVCVNERSFTILQYASTASEETTIALGRCGFPFQVGDPPPRVGVTGTMAQAGVVSMGGNIVGSATGPWTYQFDVATGTRTLVATDQSRVVVRRGVPVTAYMVLDTLDVAQGVDTVPRTLKVTDDDDSSLLNMVLLVTNGDMGYISGGTGQEIRTLPSVPEGEDQVVSLREDRVGADAILTRSTQFYLADDPTPSLLPWLGDEVETEDGADGTYVRWSELALESTDRATISVDDGWNLVLASASAGWLDHHDVSKLEIDTSMPGFDPRWRLATPRSNYFAWIRETERSYTWTSIERPGSASPATGTRCRFDGPGVARLTRPRSDRVRFWPRCPGALAPTR